MTSLKDILVDFLADFLHALSRPINKYSLAVIGSIVVYKLFDKSLENGRGNPIVAGIEIIVILSLAIVAGAWQKRPWGAFHE